MNKIDTIESLPDLSEIETMDFGNLDEIKIEDLGDLDFQVPTEPKSDVLSKSNIADLIAQAKGVETKDTVDTQKQEEVYMKALSPNKGSSLSDALKSAKQTQQPQGTGLSLKDAIKKQQDSEPTQSLQPKPLTLNISKEEDFRKTKESISTSLPDATIGDFGIGDLDEVVEVDLSDMMESISTSTPKVKGKSLSLSLDDDEEEDELSAIMQQADKVNSEEVKEEKINYEDIKSHHHFEVEPVFEDISPNQYNMKILKGDFREMAVELLQFEPPRNPHSLRDPLNFALQSFLELNPDRVDLGSFMEYKLKDFIRMDTNDPFVKLVLGIQNLQRNQSELNSTHSKNLITLEFEIEQQILDYKEQREKIINEYQTDMDGKYRTAKDFSDRIRSNLTLLNDNLDENVNAIVKGILDSKSHEFKPYFEEAMDLKNKIDAKKDQLKKLSATLKKEDGDSLSSSNEDFIRVQDDDLESIVQLINQVKNHLETLDFKDVPYFKKYIVKFFDYFFLVTTRADGEVKSLVFLLNILGFVIFLKFLSPAFIVFMLTTISIDAMQFFKLVDKSKSTAMLVQYSQDVEEKIEAIKNKALSEIREECDEQINIVERILRDKVKAMRAYCDNIEIYNANLLSTFITREEIEAMTNKKMRKIEAFIRAIGNKKLEELNSAVNSVLSDIPGEIERYADELNRAPNLDIMEKDFKHRLTWDTTYKVGRYGVSIDDLKVGIDASAQLAEGSYVIYVESREDKIRAFNALSNLIVQQYNKITPEMFKVNYVDLNGYGADVTSMSSINPLVSQVIIEEEDYKKLLKTTRAEMGNRYSKYIKGYPSLSEYNATHEKDPTMPKAPYIMNVLYGLATNNLGDLTLKSLAVNAKKAGMPLVLFVYPDEMFQPDRDGHKKPNANQQDILDTFDYKVFIRDGEFHMQCVKGTENVEGQIFPSRNGMERFKMDFEELQYMDKIKQVEGVIEDGKMTTIMYNDLREQYAPVLHQGDTLEGVDLCLGYKDGDYSRPYTCTLGDNSVHAMMGGSTGSGKSNTINVIIANLISKYSPEWLELYMLDFKIVEFRFYTRTVAYDKFNKTMSRLPHASLIAGTKDPEYAESIFKKSVAEMNRRYKMMAQGIQFEGTTYSFKKIEDWNRFVLKHNLKELGYKIIPRILIIIDEFQAMFKMEDEEKKAYIKLAISDLGKEARAAGIHMFFTSQSMDGTVPEDIKDQFLMRFCLAASPTTSKSVLGNSASSTISGKGFIYMNQHSDREESNNVKIKVPFIPPDDLLNLMGDVEESAKTINVESNNIVPFYRKEYYDEEKIHHWDELEMYTTNKKIVSEPGSIIIGNRTTYDDNPLPENFVMANGDGEHILITANASKSIANMTNTMLDSITRKNDGKNVIFYVNYDLTMEGMVKDRFKNPALTQLVQEINKDFDEILNILIEEVFDVQLNPQYNDFDKIKPNAKLYQKGKPKKYLVVNGWNKAPGFNSDVHEHYMQQKLIWILKYGPLYGLHLIMSVKEPFRLSKYLPYFSYRLVGKISADFSRELTRKAKASNLGTGDKGYFGLFKNTITDYESKFKIYEYDYDESLLSTGQLNFEIDLGKVRNA